jgi:hypothetical protein
VFYGNTRLWNLVQMGCKIHNRKPTQHRYPMAEETKLSVSWQFRFIVVVKPWGANRLNQFQDGRK